MLSHSFCQRHIPGFLAKAVSLVVTQELEKRIRVDAPAARQELLLTIEGMQCVRLGLTTDVQVSPPSDCIYI